MMVAFLSLFRAKLIVVYCSRLLSKTRVGYSRYTALSASTDSYY